MKRLCKKNLKKKKKMNTNHNRIRVSDLETDERDKILATNSKGELEFIATKNIKVDSYNALDYIQEGKALDARQGKILKDLIDNFNQSNHQQPYLDELIPNIYSPNTTNNIIIKGSFFTPETVVAIQGQSINFFKFKSDNEIHVNVTTGQTEGTFNVTINNGISKTFADAFSVLLGNIFTPEESDWLSVVAPLDVKTSGEAKIGYWNTLQSAVWNKQFDYTRNFRVQFRVKRSPLGDPSDLDEYLLHAHLINVSNGELAGHSFWMFDDGYQVGPRMINGNFQESVSLAPIIYYPTDYWETNIQDNVIEYRYVNNVLYAYYNSELKATFTTKLTENVRLKINIKRFDLVGIKYIETL